MKSIIKNAAESQVGYKKKENSKYISDPEIERMLKEQKRPETTDREMMSNDQIKELRKSRKKILKQISLKIKEAKQKLAEDLVVEIQNAKDDTEMLKAAKVLYTKHQRPGP